MMGRCAPAFDAGPIHFVGIGGIGMSGIAEVLLNLGYRVQGSDLRANPNVERLRGRGASVRIGHGAGHLGEAGVVVVSSAVGPGNREVEAAQARGIPVIRRADMLAELVRLKWTVAVAGTHGKTTTTSMIAALLDGIGNDPTVINGGIINAYGSNAKLGGGEWMVVEADESDGTFTRLRPTAAVITNIDAEHMDHYGDMAALRDGFHDFLATIPFYGFAVLCIDHPEVRALAEQVRDRRLITCGLGHECHVRAVDIDNRGTHCRFDLVATRHERQSRWQDMTLPMAGEHNLKNALAAIAVARELGGGEEEIRAALARFCGVRRRFTEVGVGAGVRVIDDYGHHPVEIAAALRAARDIQGERRVLAAVQPHRYSRLRALFDDFCACFDDADHVWVAPVFAAGESPPPDLDHEALARGLRARGHPSVAILPELPALSEAVRAKAATGDMLVCLGAGDITRHAAALPGKLAASIPD